MATVKVIQNISMVLIGISFVMQIVGFAAPYWFVVHEVKLRITIFSGLWNDIICKPLETGTQKIVCESLSHHQSLQDAGKRGDSVDIAIFSNTIPRAFRATLAFVMAIAAFVVCATIILRRKSTKKVTEQKCSMASSLLSILSGSFIITIVIDFIPSYVNVGSVGPFIHVEFPWAAFFSGLGGMSSLTAGFILLCSICKDFSRPFARRQISTLASEMHNGGGGEGYSGRFTYQQLNSLETNDWNEMQDNTNTPICNETRKAVSFFENPTI